MPSQPMATWITPCSSRSVKVVGTRTRRHTMGLTPTSQTLTCRIALASAAGSEGVTSRAEGFGRRFIRPDYRLSPCPSPDTPEILMLSFTVARARVGRTIARLLDTATMLPLISPPFTTSIAFVFSFGPRGFITHGVLGMDNAQVYGLRSTLVAEALTYFPLAYL